MPRPSPWKNCEPAGYAGVSGPTALAGRPGRAAPLAGAPWALAALLGLWLGFPNDFVSAPPLALLWPLGLAALGLSAPGAWSALRRGWLTSLAGGVAALYWLSLPVHDVGGLPWALALPCAVFIAALVTAQGGLFCAAARLGRGLSPWRLALALALVWYFLEYAFALGIGFPWLPLAGALAPWPLLVQTADTLGAYGTGALWLWAGLLALFAFPRAAGLAAPDFPGFAGFRVFRPWRLASACGLVLLTLGYGHWQLEKTPFDPEPTGPDSVALLFVEGNVDQGQKWLPAMQAETTELYCTLTEQGLAGLGWQPGEDGAEPPLVIWPETALPFFFQTHRLSANVLGLVRRERVPLLFGAPGVERPAGAGTEPDIFNRAFLLGPDGRLAGFYDKEHLVPFGEYAPSWLDWPFLEALLQGVGVYTEGTATAPLRYGNLALGMLICYEGIFPWLAQARVRDGANILADISNDGWFRGTPASRQHLYLTVLRALEQGRWLLRGTNTGISAVADTRGRLTAVGPLFRAGTLAARARLCQGESRYHRLAPWLPLMALAALLAVTLLRRRGSA